MLRRSFFRPLFSMNLGSNGLFAGKRVALKKSRICFLALLFVFVLISSRGQAQLTVTASANPSNLVWGKVSQISATASGGVAPYTFEYASYCAGDPPPTVFGTSFPMTNSFSICFNRTGTVIYVWQVTDSANPPSTVQSSVAVQVLPPNKIVPLTVGLQGNVMFQGQQVSIMTTQIFEVRHNMEKVGACADACVQTRIWNTPPFDATSTEPWEPFPCSNFSDSWGPATVELTIAFTVFLDAWNEAEVSDTLATKYCQVRVNYKDCHNDVEILPSSVYKAKFVKLSDTTGAVILERVGQ